METVTERETSCCATLLFTACKKKRSRFYANLVRWGFTPSQQWEPLLPCVAILCVDLSKHDKFVRVKNKACVDGREEDSSEERRTAGTGMLV